MSVSAETPAVRQNRSKLDPTCCHACSTIAAATAPAVVVDFSMALLSFADSAPRAYWLKAGNAYLTFSTSTGTSPRRAVNIFSSRRHGAEHLGFPEAFHTACARCHTRTELPFDATDS